MKSRYILILFLITLISVGCAGRNVFISQSGDFSETKLKPGEFEILGPVEGKSCTPRWFGFGSDASKPSLIDSETEALREKNADLLLNKIHYIGAEKTILGIPPSAQPGFPALLQAGFAVYQEICVYTEGTAIKLK